MAGEIETKRYYCRFKLQGWTTFELTRIPEELIAAALHAAYMEVVEKQMKKKKGND